MFLTVFQVYRSVSLRFCVFLCYQEWLAVRGMNENFEDDDKTVLAENLKQFYGEVNTCEGKSYSKRALIGLRSGINRYLQSSPLDKPFNIISDPAFTLANKVLLGRIKMNKENGSENQAKHRSIISPVDVYKLYSTGTLSNDNPNSLLNKVFFEMALHFGWSGDHFQGLKKSFVAFMIDDERMEYATLTHNKRDQRMYAQPRDPLCPVKSLKLYISKLDKKSNSLFQQCRRGICDLDFAKEDVWYNNAMGKNSIREMMRRISIKARLSQVYTNYCIRMTTTAVLLNANFDHRDIISVTGHKDVRSLLSYMENTSNEEEEENSSNDYFFSLL